MDSSIDLYSFAGDTAGDGARDRQTRSEASTKSETGLAESLHKDAYHQQDTLPPVAPDRHAPKVEVLKNKDGSPIIIEYNNIFIDATARLNAAEASPEGLQNRGDRQTPSPYSGQYDSRYNSNPPYTTDQMYQPCQPPGIIYGAPAYDFPGGYGGFRQPSERFYTPGYANHPEIPNYPRYPGRPTYPDPTHCPGYWTPPGFQNYPGYPSAPSASYYPNPAPFVPISNHGKLEQIASMLREMGPLAVDITALTTVRRGFPHYPGPYVPAYNYYGWNNNLANTVPISPYGVPLVHY